MKTLLTIKMLDEENKTICESDMVFDNMQEALKKLTKLDSCFGKEFHHFSYTLEETEKEIE